MASGHELGKAVGEGMKAATGKSEDGFSLKGFLSGIGFGFVGIGNKDEIPGLLKSFVSSKDESQFMELVHQLTKPEQTIIWHFIDYAFPRVKGDAVTNARVNHKQNAFRSFILNYAKKSEKKEAKADDHGHPPAATPTDPAHTPAPPSSTPTKVKKEDSPLLLLKRIVKTIKDHSHISEREGLKKAYEYLARADVPLGRDIVMGAEAFIRHTNKLEHAAQNPKGFWERLASKITI